MTAPKDAPVINSKEQELIALGASIASGCLPCTKFHLRAAASVGAAADDIAQAVKDATQVRRTATDIMAKAGGLASADGSEARPDSGQRTLIRELVSAGAAYAINCAPSVGTHLEAARALGATDAQLFAALKIACAVRDVAAQKAKAAAAAIFGVDEAHADDEDCCSDSDDTAGRSGCAPEGTGGKPCRCQ
jgi:AhpD family alkylhydroperoxidase